MHPTSAPLARLEPDATARELETLTIRLLQLGPAAGETGALTLQAVVRKPRGTDLLFWKASFAGGIYSCGFTQLDALNNLAAVLERYVARSRAHTPSNSRDSDPWV